MQPDKGQKTRQLKCNKNSKDETTHQIYGKLEDGFLEFYFLDLFQSFKDLYALWITQFEWNKPIQ